MMTVTLPSQNSNFCQLYDKIPNILGRKVSTTTSCISFSAETSNRETSLVRQIQRLAPPSIAPTSAAEIVKHATLEKTLAVERLAAARKVRHAPDQYNVAIQLSATLFARRILT